MNASTKEQVRKHYIFTCCRSRCR